MVWFSDEQWDSSTSTSTASWATGTTDARSTDWRVYSEPEAAQEPEPESLRGILNLFIYISAKEDVKKRVAKVTNEPMQLLRRSFTQRQRLQPP